MAEYSIITDDDRRLILVDVSGKIVREEGEEIITKARTLAGEKSYDVVYDMRGSYSSVQITDWFRLPRKLEVFKQPNSRMVRAAIVVNEDDRSIEQYKFFETVSKNLGFSLRIFFNIDDAVLWLGGEGGERISTPETRGETLT